MSGEVVNSEEWMGKWWIVKNGWGSGEEWMKEWENVMEWMDGKLWRMNEGKCVNGRIGKNEWMREWWRMSEWKNGEECMN